MTTSNKAPKGQQAIECLFNAAPVANRRAAIKLLQEAGLITYLSPFNGNPTGMQARLLDDALLVYLNAYGGMQEDLEQLKKLGIEVTPPCQATEYTYSAGENHRIADMRRLARKYPNLPADILDKMADNRPERPAANC